MQIEQLEQKGIFAQAQVTGAKGTEPQFQEAKRSADVSGIIRGSAPQTQIVTYQKPEDEPPAAGFEDIMNQAAAQDAVQMKNEMVVGANTSTPERAGAVEEDGFSLRDTDIHTVVTETDKIQMQLAKAGKDTGYFGDELTPEQIAQLAGSAALAAQYETALTQANAMEPLGEGALKYMLDNELEPTLGNLYQAQYNGGSAYVVQPDGRFDEVQIEEQIERVVAAAGLEVTEENLAAGKWLAANKLPVTARNLNYLNDLKQMELPPRQGQVLTAMTEAVADGKTPSDAYLLGGYSPAERAQEAMAVIEQTTDEDLMFIISQGQELTIENLREAHQLTAAGGDTANAGRQQDFAGSYSLIEARRILEEIRLAMTTEANYGLIKRGMELDIRPLVQLVDDLKAQEQSYYRELLQADGSTAGDGQVELFQETIETAQQLKGMPAYALGSVRYDGTVESLHAEGTSVQARMDAAGEAYETMMTEPRRDLGDSIQKAFRNVDDILREIGMEANEGNARAVRILAYNHLEITEESVLKMKLADRQVQQAFDSLKPAVVREMIRDGINPLKMQMSELNEQAAQIRERIGGGDDLTKFSEYLWKLEQSREISPEERDSYIGIYRLIHQVEAGDGAAIGALVQQGEPITMEGLLRSVRSGKKSGMDYSVDDSFGGVKGTMKGTSITEQVDAAFQTECFRQIQQTDAEPEQFSDLLKGERWRDLTPEQFLEALSRTQADDEQALAYYKEQIEDMQEAAAADSRIYEVLENYSMPATVNNVLALQQMMANPNDALRRFFALADRIEEDGDEPDLMGEIEKIKEHILHKLGESIQTPEELADAQNTLAEVAEHCGQTVMYAQGMSTLDIRQLQMMTTQLHLGASLAREERYQIPVVTRDGAVGVNVKIVRGSEKKGSVRITMECNTYGRVTAELRAEAKGIRGYIASDSRAGADRLTGEQEKIEAMLGELTGEGAENQVQILFSEHVEFVRFELDAVKSEPSADGETQEVQTKMLYGIMEKMIRFFREGITEEV